MARKSVAKKSSADLPSVTDPAAPLDVAAFLAAARPVLALLAADLAARAKADGVRQALEAEYAAEREARRTAESFEAWRAALLAQIAAAWVLSCVFVRTLEDRGLVAERRLAGPGAEDGQRMFLELAPSLSERDYLLLVFRELTRLPAARDLFDARHNLVWRLAPSGEAAKALVRLFRTPSAAAPAFRFGQPDTRFLGDLYQDLDDDVRDRYALLQTPRFVEKYILDRTLTRALERFGLGDTTVIDPTCGSGHFLLGAFERLSARWQAAAPTMGVEHAARKALDQIYGADLNPYAVAIARFRLTLAYLDRVGARSLAAAPALPLHLAVADSLLHNPQLTQLELGHRASDVAEWSGSLFSLEDPEAARDVLHREHAAVVGNPPYITVKDAARREEYRKSYSSAAGKYSLAAPFAERFFQLAKKGGAVGMITANSFMKREFGKKLIQECLPKWNLDGIVNTSGAYIPGHGTPTVLLFGTNEPPTGSDVLAVLAKRGEPSTPDDPEQGKVWRSLADHGGEVGFENEYVSVARVPRLTLDKHPWSLGGGGAAELKELLEERTEKKLGDIAESIGIASFTLEDDVYLRPLHAWQRSGVPDRRLRAMIIGEAIRDWSVGEVEFAFFPYDERLEPIDEADASLELRALWPWRTCLANNKLFGGKTKVQGGLRWYEFGRLTADKLRTPLSIAYAEVATHNHFVLDRGGKVFNRTAPIIKLPATATEEDHLALLAYLNSSTACFWMKQACHDKGNRGEGGGFTAEAWERFFQFSGTALSGLPVPAAVPENRPALANLAKRLLEAGMRRAALATLADLFEAAKSADALRSAIEHRQVEVRDAEAEMRGLVEHLDWLVYSFHGWCEPGDVPAVEPVAHGGRASDVLFADEVLRTKGGRRYFELCRLPSPEMTAQFGLRDGAGRLARQLKVIARSDVLRLLEQPDYKRTFREGHRPPETRAMAHTWLSELLEKAAATSASASTAAGLQHASAVSSSARCVLELDLIEAGTANQVGSLLATGAVPFLAAFRHTEAGLEKRAAWDRTWDLQRREDAGDNVGDIPVPPKYDPKDYRDAIFWRLRGKLDVPKERFISYPGCESDEDEEPLYGWAGWNHLQQAQALAALYKQRKDEGWKKDRLTPMLAGLLELLPWVKQWHNEPSAEFEGLRLGDYFESYLDTECRELGLTKDDLRAWRPAAKARGKARSNGNPKPPRPPKPPKEPKPKAEKRPRKRRGGET